MHAACFVCSCTRRVFFADFCCGCGARFFCCGCGARFFAAGARFFWLQVRGALFSVLLTRGAFFFTAGTRRVFFASGVQCLFLCIMQVRSAFFCCRYVQVCGAVCFLVPVRRAGPCMAVGCMGKPGRAFFRLGAAGRMSLEGACMFLLRVRGAFVCFLLRLRGGFRVRNSEGGLSYTWSH